ncbi:pentatricopeptide repeat-containing protein At2g01860-like [Zingiber officinale]|uniref:Pentatricopeptide repeat-containing protein n=1 Tax=Zingiber officinale TaxID=94328 RepID=A0A8J5F5A5_ZINOF|nr:pentatricopeptide repeat-containing protein At2g01860-like [Zingiber officinale]KAG6483087.1 hypothetical protein ZIOFF_059727 [Zingiber officinale]
MECRHLLTSSSSLPPVARAIYRTRCCSSHGRIAASALRAWSRRKPPEILLHPRRPKQPPDMGIPRMPLDMVGGYRQLVDEEKPAADGDDGSEWSALELEAISALFDRPMAQKPVKSVVNRPLPLPTPHKGRPPGFPSPKRHVRSASGSSLAPRCSFADRVRKNPEALIGIAREIAALPADSDACEVLDRWRRFLRKGSLSMTVRELGHMGLPDRALQTLCWVQKEPSLFPDDRTLASAVEVLARCGQLRIEADLSRYLNSASRPVIEAMARGFLKAGCLSRARKILLFAKDNHRTLDPGIYAKLISEAGKTPDGYRLAAAVLDELGEREDFDLEPQDCTAVMKVCIKLERFEALENLFHWYKLSRRHPTVVMYTTVIHGKYCEKKFREALALVWEMESSGCPFDLPAYRVVIRLVVALNDLGRATRYFSKLKDAGFSPTCDIYHDMITVNAASGRLAKCRQLRKEAEMAGLRLDGKTLSMLSELESKAFSKG